MFYDQASCTLAEGALMYGVPSDLDLTFFHNAELIQVGLGLHQVQFHFHPTGSLSVEGEWELRTVDGKLVDRHSPPPRLQPFHLHRILGQRVTRTEVVSPDWIGLRFESGDLLRVYDSSKQYESFSIEPSGVIV